MSVIRSSNTPKIDHSDWLAHLLAHWETSKADRDELRKGRVPKAEPHPEWLQFVLLHKFDAQLDSVLSLLKAGVIINAPWRCPSNVVSTIDMIQGLDTITNETSSVLYHIWDICLCSVLARHSASMDLIFTHWFTDSRFDLCEAVLLTRTQWGDVSGNIFHWALLRKHFIQIKYIMDLALRVSEAIPSFSSIFMNSQMTNGDTALHIACREKIPEIVAWLCKNGARSTIENVNGVTPLHICAKNGFHKGIELFQPGRDKAKWYNCIHDSLYLAVQHGNIDCVQRLINFGGDICQQGLMAAAAKNNHLEIVHMLCMNGSDPNVMHKNGKLPIEFTSDMMIQRTLVMYGSKLVLADHVAVVDPQTFTWLLPLHNHGILNDNVSEEHIQRLQCIRAASQSTIKIQCAIGSKKSIIDVKDNTK